MGRHNDPKTGKMPKRRKMSDDDDANPNNWNSTGRKIGYDIRESFNKLPSSHKYKAYAEKRKRKRLQTHPDATKGHRHNMAWNETVKLFLSHFWQVAHILDGHDITDPAYDPWIYKKNGGGHDRARRIPPYYFNGDCD